MLNFNVSLASSTYFMNAITYMIEKHASNTVVAVFKDDIVSSRRLLYGPNGPQTFNMIFPSCRMYSSRKMSMMLALLSSADHSILTY